MCLCVNLMDPLLAGSKLRSSSTNWQMGFTANPSNAGNYAYWSFQAVPTQVLPKHGQKVTSNICLLIATSGCAQGVQRKWQDAATHPWMNF